MHRRPVVARLARPRSDEEVLLLLLLHCAPDCALRPVLWLCLGDTFIGDAPSAVLFYQNIYNSQLLRRAYFKCLEWWEHWVIVFFVCVSLYWNRFKQVAVQIIWILINKAKCYFESNYYGTNIWIYLLPHNGRIHIRHIVKNVARTYAWIAFLFITLSFFFVALFMLRRCNDDNGDAGVHLPGEQRACGAAAVQYREAGHET